MKKTWRKPRVKTQGKITTWMVLSDMFLSYGKEYAKQYTYSNTYGRIMVWNVSKGKDIH